MKTIKIGHLYPKEMNIYGDNGNILVLQQRLLWRKIPVEIIKIGVAQQIPNDVHLLVGGGGQDAGQLLIAKDLQQKAKTLRKMQSDGIPMLMICGMYQMFGHYFKTSTKDIIPGIGLIDARTVASNQRLIGNIVSKTDFGLLVGYENHSGLTTLGEQSEPLGKVPNGQGNNGQDGNEGARQFNVIGSYLHGPVLAKSPCLADYLLGLALDIAGYTKKMSSLNDSLEAAASKNASKRNR